MWRGSPRPGDEAAIALLSEAAAAAAGTAPATAAHWYGAALRLVPEVDDRSGARPAGADGARARRRGPARRQPRRAGRSARAARARAGPLVTACAQVETELGRHAAARRRLLAALAGAAPDSRPGLAFQLAAAEFQEGRVRRLRDRSRAAVRAAAQADDRLLLAGAEALDALGALLERRCRRRPRGTGPGDGRPQRTRRRSRRGALGRARLRQRGAGAQRALRRRRGDERGARSRSCAAPGTRKCSCAW